MSIYACDRVKSNGKLQFVVFNLLNWNSAILRQDSRVLQYLDRVMILVLGESKNRLSDLNKVLIVKVKVFVPVRPEHKFTIAKMALCSDQHVFLTIDCEHKSMAAPLSLDA